MYKPEKKKKEEIGLSPYALIFRGHKKIENQIVKAIDYSENNIREFDVKTPDELVGLNSNATSSWVNVYGVDNVKFMEQLAAAFKINNLILSDVMNPSTRPKLSLVDNHLYINVKLFHFAENKSFSCDNLSLIIDKNSLISFQEKVANLFGPIRERLKNNTTKIRKSGSDYLAFAILDIVIDSYIYHIGELGEQIEELEEQMSEEVDKALPEKINSLKKELNAMRKVIKPTKELILGLAKLETDLIKDENRIHFKELVDNINEANDLVDTYREMLYDMLNMYHTNMSNKLNDIMRLLTVISVIFIPITFIAGVYGTNFEFIPELHWKPGYFIMLAVMGIIVASMIWYFKRKKWF